MSPRTPSPLVAVIFRDHSAHGKLRRVLAAHESPRPLPNSGLFGIRSSGTAASVAAGLGGGRSLNAKRAGPVLGARAVATPIPGDRLTKPRELVRLAASFNSLGHLQALLQLGSHLPIALTARVASTSRRLVAVVFAFVLAGGERRCLRSGLLTQLTGAAAFDAFPAVRGRCRCGSVTTIASCRSDGSGRWRSPRLGRGATAVARHGRDS